MAREFTVDGGTHAIELGDYVLITEAGATIVDGDGNTQRVPEGGYARVVFSHMAMGESMTITRNGQQETRFFRPMTDDQSFSNLKARRTAAVTCPPEEPNIQSSISISSTVSKSSMSIK